MWAELPNTEAAAPWFQTLLRFCCCCCERSCINKLLSPFLVQDVQNKTKNVSNWCFKGGSPSVLWFLNLLERPWRRMCAPANRGTCFYCTEQHPVLGDPPLGSPHNHFYWLNMEPFWSKWTTAKWKVKVPVGRDKRRLLSPLGWGQDCGKHWHFPLYPYQTGGAFLNAEVQIAQLCLMWTRRN